MLLLDFNLIKLKKQYDLSNAEQRVEYLTKACDILAGLTNPIQQDVYCSRLANETGTDKASIKMQLERTAARRRRRNTRKKEQEILHSGVGRKIKVDYRQKGNTMPKAYAQQQIICALVRDNSLYNEISSRLTADSFTDSDMREIYLQVREMLENSIPASYTTLSGRISDSASGSLAGIFARNADIIITGKDVQMHIENLLTAKLSRAEASEMTADQMAERLKLLKEKKK